MLPLVSVNLPTFNRARFVAQAIDSVLRQTFTNLELNIIDNISTDGTWEIISSYKDSRIRTYRNEENRGMVFSWNRAVQLSRGQYVCFLSDDDWFHPKRLEKLLKFLQDDPECWGVCDYLIEVDENGNKVPPGSGFFEAYFNRDIYNGDFHQALVNPINAEAIGLFKRVYFDEVGEFEEGVTFCDFRMHVRNLAKGLRIGSLPEQLHFKRQHANSATANMQDGLTFDCFYLFKHVYNEIYLQDRNPMHLVAYIKWLLFERAYQNVAPGERRRLLDYVTGTDFPFDTFAEFHAHVTHAAPAEGVTNPQEAAEYPPAIESPRADPEHQEMLRELMHFLVEKCLAREIDIFKVSKVGITGPNEELARLNEFVVLRGEEIDRLNELIVLRGEEIDRLNEQIAETARLKNLNPLRKLGGKVRKLARKSET
jgi:glycosyltransferase involved in cell wall biosynthesis